MCNNNQRKISLILAGYIWLLLAGNTYAQDMEPRSYANTPINLNMIVLGYSYSWGAVLVDQSLPVEELDAKINSVAPAYVRTLPIFGWASKLIVAWPYATVQGEGQIEDTPISESRGGFTDPRVRLNVNFVGAPALELHEFPPYRQKTIVGATFEVQAPLGSFDVTKPVNIGANRWTFLAELGVSRRVNRWTFEGSMGVLLFTNNDEYLGSYTLQQDPVTYGDVHAIFAFKSGIWMAFDALWVWGGQTSLDDQERADLQSNARVGATLSLPLAKRQSLKIFTTNGVTTRFGADFRSLGASWVLSWGG